MLRPTDHIESRHLKNHLRYQQLVKTVLAIDKAAQQRQMLAPLKRFTV